MLTMKRDFQTMQLSARLAHSSEQKERRGSKRREMRLELGSASPAVGTTNAIVRDLSLTGALLETPVELSVGDALAISLPSAEENNLRIIWNSGSFYGCEFEQPITEAVLAAALLQALPQQPDTKLTSPVTSSLITEVHELSSQLQAISSRLEQTMEQLFRVRR